LLYLFLYKEAYPRSTVASNVLGIVYRDMGRTEEALREFQRAIDLAVVPAAPDLANASQALMIMAVSRRPKKYLTNGGRKDPELISNGTALPNRLFRERCATMERLAREAPADDMLWLGYNSGSHSFAATSANSVR